MRVLAALLRRAIPNDGWTIGAGDELLGVGTP